MAIPKNGSLPLKIELQMNKVWVDITKHARTRFASVSPWAVRIDGSGVVTAAPVEGFEEMQAPRQFGSVMAFFGKPNEEFYGYGQVWFEIEGAKSTRTDGAR